MKVSPRSAGVPPAFRDTAPGAGLMMCRVAAAGPMCPEPAAICPPYDGTLRGKPSTACAPASASTTSQPT